MRKQLLCAVTAALGALVYTAMTASGFETAQSVTATPITSVPFTITKPGNYFLAADLVSTSPGVAISIAADEVVLDLNGRSLIAKGAAASPNVGIGVAVLNHSDCTIAHGDINGFGAYGVLLDASNGKREGNQKNHVSNVNFNSDEIGVLTISGSINVVEHSEFDGNAVGIYDIASLGGDRFEFCNFENERRREAFQLGAGIISTPGKGTLCEFDFFADCQDAGIIDQGTPDRLRFNSFVSNGATHIGGLSLGLADN